MSDNQPPANHSYEQQAYPQQSYGYHQPQVPIAPIMTMKDWMIIMLVMLIPLVNIIMMFVWAFGDGNPNRQNYFKASLLFAAILIALYIVFIVLIFGSLYAIMQ